MPPESGELSFSVQTAGSSVKAEAPAGAFRAVALERVQTLAEGDTLRLYAQEEAFPLADTPSTKASVYTGTSLPTDVSLGLMAYKYATAGSALSQWTLHTSPAVMEAVYDGSRSGKSRKWVPTSKLLWPGSGCVRYFAYAPYGASGATVTAASGSAPQIAFTVPSSYAEQVDLLVSNASSSCEYEGDPLVTEIDVPMTLQHALTGIRFRVEKGMSITSVSVTGVLNKGTLPLWGSGSHTWSPDASSTGSYTLTNPALKSENASYDITEDAYTLMLLPQTLPEGARIEAVVSGGGNSKTITAVMDGEIWPAGKLITYTITTLGNVTPIYNIETYTLDELQALTVSYTGGSGELSLGGAFRSFAECKDKTLIPIPFVLEYSADGSSGWSTTPPSWLTVSSGSSWEGSVEGETLTASIEAQLNSGEDAHHTALAAKAAKTNFDLSTWDVSTGTTVSRTTANCYVVQAPGSYRFPLVYGNAVKAGSANASAYTAASGTNILTSFKNHLDQDITTPYIASQLSGRTLTAQLVWTDVQGLVRNVSLTGSGSEAYISFEVPQETISQGNAQLAVLADGEVAWSWHIWVTDSNLSAPLTSPSGYRFLPENLGWCDARTEQYQSRVCYVRAVQTTDGGKTSAARKILEQSQSISTSGNSMFYLWGRKDMIMSSNGSGNTDKTYYAADDGLKPRIGNDQSISLGDGVRSPWIINYRNGGSQDWCTSSYYNLWDEACKTVYDPSPSGYRVPPSVAFNGLSASSFPWYTGNAGYGYGRRYGTQLFFPACGFRAVGSALALTSVKDAGVYWTGSRTSATECSDYYFTSSSCTVSTAYASNALSVRPVVDEVPVKYTYHLDAVAPTGLKAQGGSAANGFISSYRTNDYTGASEAVSWSVAGYYSNAACTTPFDGSNAANRPAWLTSFTAGGSGSAPGSSETLSATVSASSYSTLTQDIATVINNQISGNGIRGSESHRWNLSNPSSPYSPAIVESANCYIVNARGYYRIPLVMGNGVVNNALNSTAATYKGASGTYSILFQDYSGGNVTNPYLHKSSSGAVAPSAAFVVWEDVNGLIEAGSDYTLTDALQYDSAADVWWLQFHVDKAQQGNAVIAVANTSGTVMWSWHIWVTNYTSHKDPCYAQGNVTFTSDYSGGNFTLMGMNLGWLPSGSCTARVYSPRTVYVKIRQADGGEEAVVALTQAGKTEYTSYPTGGKGPFWQWGRKDAMWPSGTCYGRFASVTTLTSKQTLANAIKNPGKFIATGENSCWSSYSYPGNLWDSDTKTIWDPCPAGYTVPSQAAITLVFNQWPDNLAVGTFNNGWHFYNSAKTGTNFFAAAGLRTAASGALSEVGSGGSYWNDLMRTTDSGAGLWYFDSQWGFTAAMSRSYGLCIRPRQR